MKHQPGPICPGCEDFLREAHPALRPWFYAVKEEHKDAHISCSFRGKEDQEDDYRNARSQLNWPNSRHNRTFPSGEPAAEALDLFRLTIVAGKQVPTWPWDWYENIAAAFARVGDVKIVWGGAWKTLKDGPHFELDFS